MLQKAVSTSSNFCQVLRALGSKATKGGSYELVKSRCNEYGIDTSHFTGQKFTGNDNPSFKSRYKKEDILTSGKIYRVSHRMLKRALIESGVPYECRECTTSEWMGKPITLDVDHIDGDWSNCQKDNLRFICPNCHRQTDTFGRKKLVDVAEMD